MSLAWREDFGVGVVYYCQTDRRGHIRREPFQMDAICRQSCKLPINRRFRTIGVVARRTGAVMWVFGMRFISVVRRLCRRIVVRDAIGMVAE